MTKIVGKEILNEKNHEKLVMQVPEDWIQEKKALISTTTGELFMPARLYLKFINKKALIKALYKRKCIDLFDDNTFNISYWEEAKTINLKVPYDAVPENVFPVLLARGKFVGASEVHIDVRSFDRAIEILKFLNKYIGTNFMYATHIATYNRLFEIQDKNPKEILNIDYDEMFSEAKLQQAAEQEYAHILSAENSENAEETQKQLEEIMNKPIPEVRKLSVKNTSADLNRLSFSLTIAQLCAKAYCEGNKNFGPLDMISMLLEEDKEEDAGGEKEHNDNSNYSSSDSITS